MGTACPLGTRMEALGGSKDRHLLDLHTVSILFIVTKFKHQPQVALEKALRFIPFRNLIVAFSEVQRSRNGGVRFAKSSNLVLTSLSASTPA